MGTAVGVASFIGYLPEGFTYPLIGYWLDTHPGLPGYQITFSYMLAISLVGILAALLLWRVNRHNRLVAPSLTLAARIGPMHTAATYVNLCSLLHAEPAVSSNIGVFSFGKREDADV